MNVSRKKSVKAICAAIAGHAATSIASTALADDLTDACFEAANDYFVAIDSNDRDGFLDVFTDDATLTFPDGAHEGKEAIAAFFDGRPANRKIIHHVTTRQLKATSDVTAEGLIYVLLIGSETTEVDGETKTNSAMVTLLYSDKYETVGDACKISERSMRLETMNPL